MTENLFLMSSLLSDVFPSEDIDEILVSCSFDEIDPVYGGPGLG